MRPGPGFGEVGELLCGLRVRVQIEHLQPARRRRRRAHDARALCDDDQDEPWPQALVRRCRGRGEEPRQVGPVELDRYEVVGLGIGRARRGVGADDLAGVEARDVAGPEQCDLLVDAQRVARLARDVDRHAEGGAPRRAVAQRVGAGQRRGAAPPHPPPAPIGRRAGPGPRRAA